MIAFRIGDVGSQEDLDRLEVVAQPVHCGNGHQLSLPVFLFGPQAAQVTDPQQEGARQSQDQQGGDQADAGGGAKPRMTARPFSGPFPERGLGGVLERTIL